MKGGCHSHSPDAADTVMAASVLRTPTMTAQETGADGASTDPNMADLWRLTELHPNTSDDLDEYAA